MAFKELGGFAPMLSIGRTDKKDERGKWVWEPGAWFIGHFVSLRSYMDRRNETPKQKWMLTFIAEDHQGCTAQARGEKDEHGQDTYFAVDVIPHEPFTLELGTVLGNKLKDVLTDPERFVGCRFRITYLGLGKVTVKGRQPAKLYKVECDESTKAMDAPAPSFDEEA